MLVTHWLKINPLFVVSHVHKCPSPASLEAADFMIHMCIGDMIEDMYDDVVNI